MRAVFLTSVLFCLMLYGNTAFAQQKIEKAPVEAKEYIANAKFDATIYRGPVALKYPFSFKGTYYAYEKEFVKSSVEYNRKWYYGVELNLDASRDELCLSLPGSGIVIVLSKELVGRFVIGENEFINVKGDIPGLKEGYYQLLESVDGTIYKKIVKKYNKLDGITLEFFPVEKYYWLKNGVAKRYKKIRRLGL